MKANTGKRGLTILLLAVFITGSTLLLNGSITKAQALEDSKIITASAAPSQSVSSTDAVSSAAESQGISSTDVLSSSYESKDTSSTNAVYLEEQTKIVSGTIIKDPANPSDFTIEDYGSNGAFSPTDKDMSVSEAAITCANAIQKYMDGKITNGRMGMTFTKNESSIIHRDMWDGYFTTADGTAQYFCMIDSVTGQIYNLTKFPVGKTNDTQNYLEKSTRDILLNDPRYASAASDYINAKMQDKTIVTSKNFMVGSISGGAPKLIVSVDVELSDGTGYDVQLGYKTLEVLSLEFYPNGVASFYSTH